MSVIRSIEGLKDSSLGGYFNISAATRAVEGVNIIFEKFNETKALICDDLFRRIGEKLQYPRFMEDKYKKFLVLDPIEKGCEEYFNDETRSNTGLTVLDCRDIMLNKINLFYKYFTDEYAPDNENSIWAPIVDQCNKTIELFTNESTTELFTNESTTELPIQQIEYFYVIIGVPTAVLALAAVWTCGKYCYVKHKETNYTSIIDINTKNVTTGLLTEEESEISAAEISAAGTSAAEISAEGPLDEVLVNS
jgi:hypothetical protein